MADHQIQRGLDRLAAVPREPKLTWLLARSAPPTTGELPKGPGAEIYLENLQALVVELFGSEFRLRMNLEAVWMLGPRDPDRFAAHLAQHVRLVRPAARLRLLELLSRPRPDMTAWRAANALEARNAAMNDVTGTTRYTRGPAWGHGGPTT
jgi:hypothetical protein